MVYLSAPAPIILKCVPAVGGSRINRRRRPNVWWRFPPDFPSASCSTGCARAVPVWLRTWGDFRMLSKPTCCRPTARCANVHIKRSSYERTHSRKHLPFLSLPATPLHSLIPSCCWSATSRCESSTQKPESRWHTECSTGCRLCA